MSTAAQYPHIEFDDRGEALVAETRYKVEHLAAEHFQHGWTAEELLRQHPELRPEQVYASLAYFYDHYDSIVSALEDSLVESQTNRQRDSLSRSELLRRKTSGSL